MNLKVQMVRAHLSVFSSSCNVNLTVLITNWCIEIKTIFIGENLKDENLKLYCKTWSQHGHIRIQ